MPVGNNSRPAQPFSMRVKNSKGKANEGFAAAGLNALEPDSPSLPSLAPPHALSAPNRSIAKLLRPDTQLDRPVQFCIVNPIKFPRLFMHGLYFSRATCGNANPQRPDQPSKHRDFTPYHLVYIVEPGSL